MSSQAEIYSLKTNSWREIQPHGRFRIEEDSSRVTVKGKFHWAACEKKQVNAHQMIAAFDIGTEVFSRINLPNVIGINDDDDDLDDDEVNPYEEGIEKLDFRLVVWKEDCLGLITYRRDALDRYFDVWVMEEYGVEDSWTKYFTFGQHTNVHHPLGCNSIGEIMLYKDNGQLVMYDSLTHRCKIVPVHGVPFCREVFNYVGSLIPIEGGKTVKEANLEAVEPDPFFVRKFDMQGWY